MIAEIISIGTELLHGDIVDTNSAYLAEKLTGCGIDVHYISTVGDNKQRLYKTLQQAVERADLIITTGGLGPTMDDLTREAISEITTCPLVMRPDLVIDIEGYFNHKRTTMTPNNLKQSYLPEGAIPINNPVGTAPGILLEKDNYIIISLPGVPREMKIMFEESVLPYIKKKNNLMIISKELHFIGIGESTLETKLEDIMDSMNPSLALLAGDGEVKLKITGKGRTKKKIENKISEIVKTVRNRVGEYIYGEDETSLPDEIGKLLSKRGVTIALAESCTGGLIGARITDIPGSSAYFKGGVIAYSNEVKINHLGVNKNTINKEGAVSPETAAEMASGVRQRLEADIGLSVTGIAGPEGGTDEKPVGLVYVGLAGIDGEVKTYKLNFKGDRNKNRWLTTQSAFYYLYRYLKFSFK
ncbi:competence/damage-inducible protein A [Halothermothrix orenii]|uniref:Putative competence-damage inducible protein n=1 Tax=Halothermothrix orenii (strain H 168 / OCM 544 / DSM 9562) TaxID=373903 RepID=CINA_HALOH|nr:competence/damage-inducible protein A [Halothermothrix orenii]B8CXC3.1 RecName: Full=Putative competence-damage inducible protein [Halothermothrix orenii H 168]ACL69942.1 competence/damage-inducible protein CinA [Halothermothrix orenii H 168]